MIIFLFWYLFKLFYFDNSFDNKDIMDLLHENIKIMVYLIYLKLKIMRIYVTKSIMSKSSVQYHVWGYWLRIKRVHDNINTFLHYVNVMIIVFVPLFVFVIKNYVFLGLLNIWFENFIRWIRKFAPFINFVLEMVIPDVCVSIRNTNVITFCFQNSRNLFEHFFRILFRECST